LLVSAPYNPSHNFSLTNIPFLYTDVFAFDMFDTDSDGILSEADVHVMFNELLGQHHAHTAQNEL